MEIWWDTIGAPDGPAVVLIPGRGDTAELLVVDGMGHLPTATEWTVVADAVVAHLSPDASVPPA